MMEQAQSSATAGISRTEAAWLSGRRSLRFDQPIRQQVFELLHQAIIELRIRPGQALSEADIARQLGVSRQPVREAFIRLRESGLLHVLPSRGTFVVRISAREALNARFVREAVECALVCAACTLIDEAGLAGLRDNLGRQQRAVEAGDAARFYALDGQFHRLIAASADCDYAARIVDAARLQLDRLRYLSLPHASPLATLLAQHRTIFEALQARDPSAATAAMSSHLREIIRVIPQLAMRYPDLFEDADVPRHAQPQQA